MNNEFIIVNKTAILKRIEECNKCLTFVDKTYDEPFQKEIDVLQSIISQSTSLMPVIENAIQFGKDNRYHNSFITEDFSNTQFIDYHDSTEETINYISNLKLDI